MQKHNKIWFNGSWPVLALVGAALMSAAWAAKPDPLATLLESTSAQQDAWDRLAILCDDVGNRLAGSAGMKAAVEWSEGELGAIEGLKVWKESVQVPVWVRGDEQLQMLAPRVQDFTLLGLGGTVGTSDLPDGAVEADVVVAHSFDDLGPQVANKIVLYNVPMEPGEPTIERYGPAVQYRSQGASRAAEHGAVAVLVRSVTTRSLSTPHTGALRYDEEQKKIPAAAVTPEIADHIDRLTARGKTVRLRLRLGAQTLPDAESHNVLADLVGTSKPEEVVVIGAHLDSWDVGQGAHDDGAGVVHVIEAMRHLASLDKRPARTIRAVLFTNEENGLRGGKAYAAVHEKDVHVAAVESDLGGGAPLAWGATGTEEQMAWLRKAAEPLNLPVNEGGGGADISPLKDQGVLVIGLRPDDTHYFDIHHTHADTVDKVDPEALQKGVSAMAGLAWQLANEPL